MNPAPRAQCVALGSAIPDRRLTNADLAKSVSTTDEWIRSRTGICERRIVEPGTPLSVLAIAAARDCLTRANVDPTTVDGIILATITGDYLMPATANLVQAGIGASRAWAFDLVNACNGFLSAMTVATSFIESGRARRLLVLGGDVMSSVIDPTDRNTCILFGDGCGAALVEAGTGTGGVVGFRMRSDGTGANDLIIPNSGSKREPERKQVVFQNGRTVFTHAVRAMAEIAGDLMAELGLTGDDIDLLVPHQANLRIIEATAERCGLPMDKVVVNIDRLGNTTGATLPLALAEAQADGRLTDGTRVLLVAFGGGYSWGACYLIWGRP